MNEDLHLFLGGSTEKFTSWLQTILNKLKSITIGNPNVVNAVVIQQAEDPSNSNEDTGVPELLAQTEIDEFAQEQEESNMLANPVEVSQLADLSATETFDLNSPPPSSAAADNMPVSAQKVQLHSSTHYVNPNCSSSGISRLQPIVSQIPSQPVSTTSISAATNSNNKHIPPSLQMDLISNYSEKPSQKIVSDPFHGGQAQTNIQLAKNRKRRIPGSVIGTVIHHSSGEEEEEEYDPYNPSYGSVASVVRVTERKSSIPPELQANKCLLMKAVKEAHQSLATQEKKNAERALIKPMPHVIPEKRPKLSEKMQQKRMLIYSQPKLVQNPLSYEKPEDSYEMSNYINDEELNAIGKDSRFVECKSRPRIAVLKQTPTPSPLEGRLKPISNPPIDSQIDEDLNFFVDCTESSTFEEETDENNSSRIVKDNKRENPKTQFIVTLDGYDKTQLPKTTTSLSSQAETMETAATHLPVSSSVPTSFNVNSTTNEEVEMVPEKKLATEKIAENCKFWPSCQNGTNCKYQHPSVACSKFPNCKFGDKCAYLHPKCKFDTNCNRFDCAFSHTLPRPTLPLPPLVLPMPPSIPPPPPPVVPVIPTAAPSLRLRPPCKFFPTCKNMSCPFNHPKPCRFGISCTKKAFCNFYHPPLPTKNKLRWKADKSLLSDDAANLADPMELNLDQWNNPYKVVNAANA